MVGSGLGKLVKYITEKASTTRAAGFGMRPRVQVTGPKVQPELCQICMGKIKEGTEYVRCSSGRVFHAVCLARVGQCPYCHRTLATKGKEADTARELGSPLVGSVALPAADAPSVEAGPTEEYCPACGKPLEPGATSCSCGTIFVTDDGVFTCPTCGSLVDEGDSICPNCGERFLPYEPPRCPVCGSQIPPGAEVCACGTVLTNLCPECGAELKEGDPTCPTCGTEYDFL